MGTIAWRRPDLTYRNGPPEDADPVVPEGRVGTRKHAPIQPSTKRLTIRKTGATLNFMVEQHLDSTFTALANPTRRGMLADLMLGEKSIGELAAPHRMSFAGASKHVSVLAHAGLIERYKVGRQHLCRIRPERLKDASDWLGQWQRFWTTRLDALERALKDDVAPRTRASAKPRKEDSHD